MTGIAQTQPKATPKVKPTPKPAVKPAATPVPTESEDQVFEKARDTAALEERVQNLKSFLEKFPASAHKLRVLELIVSARAQEAEVKMQNSDVEGGVKLFELAVFEAPEPFSDQLYRGVISLIPKNLFYRGQGAAAIRIADIIEKKAGSNTWQLLDLAKFHLSIENAGDAQRVAKKAVEADPNSAIAYETLGLAYRTNLQIAEAADAYEKGLQTGTRLPNSVLYLADAKRAVGKPEEALALYKELLEKQPDNIQAKTGVVLALFDAGRRAEAETELQNALTAKSQNFILLAGAAYWYAAHNESEKAIELAEKAIAAERRYVWAYIALARGLLLQKRTVEAERTMLQASQYGTFPTVHYELANAKFAVGFYEEAIADLRRSFTIKDGKLDVNLAGRVHQSGDSFIEILAAERRASLYEPLAADTPENAKKLRDLLALDLKLTDPEAKEADIVEAVDVFVGANDPMQVHRRLYAATRLLQKKIASAKVLELTEGAIPGLDAATQVPGASSAVLAEDLIQPRATALTKGTSVVVPDIQRPILLSILRGRVEELSGWALYQQQKPDEAVVRLRRAINVLPEKSAWWRSSLWKLGTILDGNGKSQEAFETYSKSFVSGTPDPIKFAVLQGLCQRLYNSADGCEERVIAAAKADSNVKKSSSAILKATPTPIPVVAPDKPKTEAEPEVKETPKPEVRTEDASTLPVTTIPEPKPQATDTPASAPVKEVQKEPEASPSPTPERSAPEKSAEETAKAEPSPAPVGEVEKNDGEGRKRTVTKPVADTKADAKNEDGKAGVVYSNPTAQVRVANLSDGAKPACQILIADRKISLIHNGGWGALTIDLQGEGKLEDIKVSAENPEDLAVELQPGIGKDIQRVMYVVRSISDKKGEFKVFVESPCGEKRELVITVR